MLIIWLTIGTIDMFRPISKQMDYDTQVGWVIAFIPAAIIDLGIATIFNFI